MYSRLAILPFSGGQGDEALPQLPTSRLLARVISEMPSMALVVGKTIEYRCLAMPLINENEFLRESVWTTK
jgi:hypothetical protein